jgi:hypothetical protein
VWGLHHYRNDVPTSDPTSPLGPSSGANVRDPKVVGVVFWYDDHPESRKAMIFRYLSDAPHVAQVVRERWNRKKSGERLKVTELAPDTVEVSLPLGSDDDWKPFLDVLLSYWGHRIVLE